MKLALVNHLTNVPDVTAQDLSAFAIALSGQLAEACANWGVEPPEAVYVASLTDTLDAQTFELAVWDTPDQPGAAGYHTTDPRGKPYGKVFWAVCDGVRSAPTLSLSRVLSHEALELWWNRFVNVYVRRADGATLVLREACDAVEDTGYPCPRTGCDLSNYLLTAAFTDLLPGPFDRLGILQHRDAITAGGYSTSLTAGFSEAGELRLRCIVHYGPSHVMAIADPTEVEARRQQIKSEKQRKLHLGLSIEWCAADRRGVPTAASGLERAQAHFSQTPEIPPPPRAPAFRTPTRSAPTVRNARRASPAFPSRTRIRGTTHQRLNPTQRRRTPAAPSAQALQSRSVPAPRRNVRFHDEELSRGSAVRRTAVGVHAPTTTIAPVTVTAPVATRPAKVPVLPKRRPVRSFPSSMIPAAASVAPGTTLDTANTVPPPASTVPMDDPVERRPAGQRDTIPLPPIFTPPPPRGPVTAPPAPTPVAAPRPMPAAAPVRPPQAPAPSSTQPTTAAPAPPKASP